MKKNYDESRLVLPYLEKELQPRRIPAWLAALFMAFVFGVLLFPFYA